LQLEKKDKMQSGGWGIAEEEERTHEKQQSKQQAQKMAKKEEKKTSMNLNESKKVIYALWMAKICFQVGEAFHNPINIHPISQPLLARLNYFKHFSILARVTSANPS
jgi:hypothetical protein